MQETSVANAWFELLSVVHMMAMLTLCEADTIMNPKDYSGSGFRVVSTGLCPFSRIQFGNFKFQL